MNKYLFEVPVESVHGHQVYEVEANSLEEAERKIREGDAEWVSDEIEVEALDFEKAHLISEEKQNGGEQS